MLTDVNLMNYQQSLKIKKEDNQTYIYDPLRKKYLVLQPEELVRQLFVQYLLQEKKYQALRISIEVGLKVNELQKRCDILVYDREFNPFMIVECKAAQVPVNEAVLYQAANYNIAFKVPYIVLTNGIVTYCAKISYAEQKVELISFLPDPA